MGGPVIERPVLSCVVDRAGLLMARDSMLSHFIPGLQPSFRGSRLMVVVLRLHKG